MSVLRPLLSGIVDYAGLFPPASLDMATAARNYAQYRAEHDAWMLGRFVVPVARLDELVAELDALDVARDGNDEWPIAALVGDDHAADVAKVDAINDAEAGRLRVDTLEAKAASASAIGALAAATGGRFNAFAEIPIDREPRELIAAIGAVGLNAKVRTGGVTPDAFPRAADIARFMRRCAEARVPFKATAGLHHPLRAEYRLTYAPDAPRGMMYGYLNVFLTAAWISELSDAEAVALLEEQDSSAIEVSRDAIVWRGHDLRPDQAGLTREMAAASFGSCSFREPVDELRALSLLP